MSEFSIASWDGGIDKISTINSKPYQLPSDKSLFADKSKQHLRSAVNITLDNSSKPMLRPGLTNLADVTDCKALLSTYDYLYFQDGTSINKRDNLGDVTLVTTLSSSAVVRFFKYADGVYYYSSTDLGRIVDGVALNWGCSICPPPALSAGVGALKAGRYQVAATFVDAYGIEHAADTASVIQLAAAGGIVVDISTVDSAATHVNIYATKADHIGLFYVATVAVGNLPYTITSVAVEEYLLETQFLSPPEDVDGVFDYNGSILTYTGEYIFTSLGVNHHVFDKKVAVEGRPSNILAGSGLQNGFWTVCDQGAFWTTGDNPADWETVQVDDFRYASGSVVIPGYLLGFIKSPQPVALFVSEHGLMIGSNSGTILAVNHHQISLDVSGKVAHFAYDRENESNQILFFLR